MRLHSLEVTAFGPFPDPVRVDFDSLSDAGLFLLTGPTGAGKSSVLDAVCFALYGDVPGDRAAAKRLRCDTAPDGVAPRVVLEATLGDRRFRISRSPAWQRPKRRGHGLTTQQASVLLEELTADGAHLLSNRLDEAGQLVSTLLGMNLSQFCQVAMLPQGRFQEFLRARSEARHQLLQKLFRTRRFDEIERWLREHRLGLRRRLDAQTAELAALGHRVEEAAGSPFDVALLDDDEALTHWVGQVVERSREAAAAATALAMERDAADRSAHEALAAGTELAGQHARLRSARATLDLIAGEDAEVCALEERVAAATRAAPVGPVHGLAVAAEGRRATAEAHLAGLVDDHDCPTHDTARDEAEDIRRRLAHVSPLGVMEAELVQLASRCGQLKTRIAGLAAEESELLMADTAWPERLERLRASAAAARTASHQLDAARAEVERGTQRHTAAAELVVAQARLVAARGGLSEVVDAHQAARETWLTLHEQRLHGMAAEIALDLAVGASCPVCGSCEHPHPAAAAPGAPTAAAEKAARRAVDDAELHRLAQADEVRALDTRVAVLTQRSDALTPDEAEAALGEARRDLARLEPLATMADRLDDELARADQEQERRRHRLATVRLYHASAVIELDAATARRAHLAKALAEGLGDHPDVAALGRALEHELRRLTETIAAHQAVDAARKAEAEAQASLLRVARDQGFSSPGDAVGALVEPAVLATHQERIAVHHRRRAAAVATLAEPELVDAAARPAPDLAGLADAQAVAAEAVREAHAAREVAQRALARVDDLRQRLVRALAAWRPTRDAHELAQRVASFAEGKSPDNREQMRLSAYVLSWRLGQVVAAANVRLGAMTDQRFILEHTLQRGAGETRGGLSLLVRDEWSGESRDPVTLSGGETFVVSLALALGLTDVVTYEAGGADIGTLFVDEGFGTLDADTLDDVMDTLDSLRDGGRAVGIVSHVPELRTRIPTQLRIAKSRTGSTVSQVHAPA